MQTFIQYFLALYRQSQPPMPATVDAFVAFIEAELRRNPIAEFGTGQVTFANGSVVTLTGDDVMSPDYSSIDVFGMKTSARRDSMPVDNTPSIQLFGGPSPPLPPLQP